jgi:hypothetical protein
LVSHDRIRSLRRHFRRTALPRLEFRVPYPHRTDSLAIHIPRNHCHYHCHSSYRCTNRLLIGHSRNRKSCGKLERIAILTLDLVMTILLFIYVPARLSLIAQALGLLRSPPPSALTAVHWTKYLPHLFSTRFLAATCFFAIL